MNRSLNNVNKTKSTNFQVRKQTKTKEKKLKLRKQTKNHVRNTEQKLILLLIIKRSVGI